MEQIMAIINPNFLIPALAIIIILDIITGIHKSLKTGEFEARKMVEGLDRQFLCVVPIILCYVFDILVPVTNRLFTNTATLFYIIYELSSVIENLDALGFPIPPFVRKTFNKVKSTVEDEDVLEKN